MVQICKGLAEQSKILKNEESWPAGIDWDEYKGSKISGLKVTEVTAFCSVTLHIECAAMLWFGSAINCFTFVVRFKTLTSRQNVIS
jgi:hypothetical protein